MRAPALTVLIFTHDEARRDARPWGRQGSAAPIEAHLPEGRARPPPSQPQLLGGARRRSAPRSPHPRARLRRATRCAEHAPPGPGRRQATSRPSPGTEPALQQAGELLRALHLRRHQGNSARGGSTRSRSRARATRRASASDKIHTRHRPELTTQATWRKPRESGRRTWKLVLMKLRTIRCVADISSCAPGQATEDNLPHREFLYRLFQDEVERRDGNSSTSACCRAGFEDGKTIEDFDFPFNPEDPQGQGDRARHLRVRREGGERPACSVRPALGSPTSRRRWVTGLAGAGNDVLYVPRAPHALAARGPREGTAAYERRLHRSRHDRGPDRRRPGASRHWRGDEPSDLFEIVRRRYEPGSMIITSNREIGEWDPPSSATSARERRPWTGCSTTRRRS